MTSPVEYWETAVRMDRAPSYSDLDQVNTQESK